MSEMITEAPKTLERKHAEPRSIIPWRAAKIVGCAGIAILVFVAAITQSVRRMPDPLSTLDAGAAVPAPTAEDVQQLEAYLRQKQVEMAKAKVAAATAPAPALAGPTRTSGTGPRRTAEADEIGETAPRSRGRTDDRYADEMARREYESLFASSTIPATSTRAGAATRPAPPSAPGRARLVADDEPDPQSATLDEVTRAVLKEMGPAVLAPPALQPVPPATPPPAAKSVQDAKAAPVRPAGSLVVFEGTVLDSVTVNRIDGSGTGPVKALLVNPVYSHDLKLLIPAGAAVLGKSSPAEGFDDGRLAIGFHRLITPDGASVSLDQFVGLSQRGDAGVVGKVNHRYLQTFGAAAAIGLISGLGQWVASGGGYNRGDGSGNTTVVLGSTADATSQAVAQTMSHFLNRRPTVTIPENTPVKIFLTSDLYLPEYREK